MLQLGCMSGFSGSESGVSMFVPMFANLSAISLPLNPSCPGIQLILSSLFVDSSLRILLHSRTHLLVVSYLTKALIEALLSLDYLLFGVLIYEFLFK